MSIFEFSNYKSFFNNWLKNQPSRGRGILSSLAQELNVNTSLLSLIFKGDSHLTHEQAVVTAHFLQLNQLQTEYFIQLVNLERTGRHFVKKYIQGQLELIKQEANIIQNRIQANSDLKDDDYAQFFSHWLYTGIYLYVATSEGISRYKVLQSFNADQNLLLKVLDFLLQKNILSESNNQLSIGKQEIYVGQKSDYLRNHLINWRLRANEVIQHSNLKDELFFSYPVVISKKDREIITDKILKWIEEFSKIARPSSSEEMMCLNIDWFKIRT